MDEQQEQETTEVEPTPFDTTRRGYDRRQVNDRINLLKHQLAAVERALSGTRQRCAFLEAELAEVRRQLSLRPGSFRADSFGDRLTSILRLAEEEAAEIRTRAEREAARRVAAAEALRAGAEREAQERDTALRQREQELARALDRLRSLRDEVTGLLSSTAVPEPPAGEQDAGDVAPHAIPAPRQDEPSGTPAGSPGTPAESVRRREG